MTTIIALILQVLISLVSTPDVQVVVIPARPQCAPTVIASVSNHEDGYWCQAYDTAEDEFTALFNSYETKVAKNGAMMIRRGNSGSFKFAKKGN